MDSALRGPSGDTKEETEVSGVGQGQASQTTQAEEPEILQFRNCGRLLDIKAANKFADVCISYFCLCFQIIGIIGISHCCPFFTRKHSFEIETGKRQIS
jgi:hypothetical protein